MVQPTVPLPPPPPGPMPPVSSAPPEASKRTYDCTICAAKFDHHYALKRHMRRRDHLNEKTFKCKICGVAFTLEQNLTRHYQTSHKKSDDTNQAINGMPSVMAVMAETNHSRKLSDLVSGLMELFECGTCNEIFTKYEQYRAHVTSSHPELKRFTCPHRACSDAFDQLEALIDHVKKTHAQVKPEPGTKRLRCTMCSKEFTRSDALRRHWRVHEREKRLPCPFNKILKCGQTFYRMDALKRHLETHKNPKFLVSTLSCDHCQKLFRSQAELERHRNLAHQTRQHQCDSCGKGFAKAHALRVHSCPVKQEAKVKRSKAAKKSWQRRAFGRRIDKQQKPPSEESTAPDQTLMLIEDEEETDLIIDETVS